jgi:hypothetical protein
MKTKIAATLLCALAFLATSCSTMTTPAPMKGASPAAVTLQDFKLVGELGGDIAAFTLTGNVRVENAAGGSLELLAGPVALTSLGARQKWQMSVDQNRFVAKFDRSGIYPIEVHFNAAVTQEQRLERGGFPRRAERGAAGRAARFGGGHGISVRQRRAAGTQRHQFHELPAGGRRGEICLEAGAAGGRGKIVLRGGDDFADQRQPWADAAGGFAQRQNHAGRDEPPAVAAR